MMDMVGGCCVCLDERGWDENPLVYCDGHGCNVAVHQACYGIVKVPKGPWFCCKCQSTERVARVKCELCPFKEGALKRTDNGGWAHVVCALYIPEVQFGNVSTMEPILLSSVPHDRFQKMCYICEENGRESKTSNGACMACNRAGCKHHFHVTCAQSKRMLCEEAGHYGNVQYVGYCSQHWTKKFGQRSSQSGSNNSDIKKSMKDKEKQQKSRQDSVSSSDGATSGKHKYKKQSSSKSNPSSDCSVDVITQAHALLGKKADQNNIKQEQDKLTATTADSISAEAEKSAVESLNLLQQMPSMIDYFPPDARPKTPLNSAVPPLNAASLTGDTATTATTQKQSVNGIPSTDVADDLIDVESSKTPPLFLGTSTPTQHNKSSEKVGENSNSKSAKTHAQKSSTAAKKLASNASVNSKQGSSTSSKSNACHDSAKKRKNADQEKMPKKQKVEDKKKVNIKKREKNSDLTIPRPSKLRIYDDERMPHVLSPSKGEHNAESLRDLLESQWDQGAQLLMQKATNFNVGSLLSCLHQLRAENDDLEVRLRQLSARRDRLIATTSRISTPFDVSAGIHCKPPLSSMLSKLNSRPGNDVNRCEARKSTKSKSKDSKQPRAKKMKKMNHEEAKKTTDIHETGRTGPDDSSEDSSLVGLDALSENNCLNSSPKGTNKSPRSSKREPVKNNASSTSNHEEMQNSSDQNYVKNLQSLVQPIISMTSDPAQLLGGVAKYSDHHQSSPPELIQQQQPQQMDLNRPDVSLSTVCKSTPTILDFLASQLKGAATTGAGKSSKDSGDNDKVVVTCSSGQKTVESPSSGSSFREVA
eukprot:gene3018-3476_t